MLTRLLTLLVILVVGIGGLALGVGELREARASLAWPSVPAVIERSDAGAREECITFSYRVAGQAYTATTVLFREEEIKIGERRPSCREDVVRRYPAGMAVVAWYDPKKPAYATLEPGPNIGTYFLPAVGVVFTLAGALFLLNETAGWRLRRRLRGRHDGGTAPARHSVDLLTSPLITPSEVVAINGAEFAVRVLGENIGLVNGGKASARQLVLAELAVAILAQEQAGTIQLEVSATPKPRLELVTTGTTFNWPTPSAESRLQQPLSGRDEASVIVRRWLASPSQNGWRRAAEKVHIPLVLRRVATLRQIGRGRRYTVVNERAKTAAAEGLPAVKDLLHRCESERPEVWQLLTEAITSAVDGFAQPPSDLSAIYEAVDPWYDEAADDVKSVAGLVLFGDVKASGREVLIWGTLLWSAVAAAAYISPPGVRKAIGLGLISSALLFAAGIRWRRAWIGAVLFRWPRLQPMFDASLGREWKTAAVTVIPIGALIIAFAYVLSNNPVVFIGLAAGVAIVAMFLARNLARQAITRQVVGIPSSVGASPPVSSDDTLAPHVSQADQFTGISQLEIRIVKPVDLPEISEHTRKRILAIRNRGPQLRSLFHKSVAMISVGSLVVALVAWWLLSPEMSVSTFPWFTAVLLVLTIAVLFGARSSESKIVAAFLILRYALRYLRGGAALERNRWEREITPIRPVIAPLLHLFWVVFTTLRVLAYVNAPTPLRWVPIVGSVVIVVSSSYRLRRGRSMLETSYPVYAPLNLLTLRVFGSPTRFADLLDLWHWFGPLYRLDGPDTAGNKASDVLAYATGRLDKAITEDAAELEGALAAFSQTRDSQLRFEFHSLQCNDRIWKDALQRLLERADIVVMDLSGFTEKNRGCAYEIGRLVNDVPVERVLLLIDDETDLDGLRHLLSEVEARPSAGITSQQLRLFHLGSQPIRRDQESIYEWQRRATTPIDADRLIGLLCDAALTKRPAPYSIRIPWTRPGYRSAPVV